MPLRYVCPKHSDVILFDIARTDGVEHRTFWRSTEEVKKCEKCNKYYALSECVPAGARPSNDKS
jgi:hypothetical protein